MAFRDRSIYDLRGSALFAALVALREEERAQWGPLPSGEDASLQISGLEPDELQTTITVYHSTSRERAESILREGFRFPTAKDGVARGLKLGAAVYFGASRSYCEHEALNTLEDAARRQLCTRRLSREAKKKLRDEQRLRLATIVARVRVAKRLSLGDYDGWKRKAKYGGRGLKEDRFDKATERITREGLRALGDYEVITINESTDAFELAVFEPSAIVAGSLRLLTPTDAGGSPSPSSVLQPTARQNHGHFAQPPEFVEERQSLYVQQRLALVAQQAQELNAAAQVAIEDKSDEDL